ncbi:MAG: NAD(P)H-binding protein [Flavobacteriaceae bacterium]|nr:NAD(P)H-binding protein [Flavobacteriaceae bacterium]
MNKHHALVLGATGATGRELVTQLLAHPSFASVSIFVRKKPVLKHQKLNVHEIDFSKLNSYKNLVVGDVLFSALGTTRKDAGSKPKQYEVDYTYQYEFAKMASENGVKHYALVSSYGANKDAWFFYLKLKGALEEEIKKLPLKSIKIYQPPTLIRQADLLRPAEKRGIRILNTLNRFGILQSQKPLLVSVLAKKMIDEALHNKQGKTTYQPKDIEM